MVYCVLTYTYNKVERTSGRRGQEGPSLSCLQSWPLILVIPHRFELRLFALKGRCVFLLHYRTRTPGFRTGTTLRLRISFPDTRTRKAHRAISVSLNGDSWRTPSPNHCHRPSGAFRWLLGAPSTNRTWICGFGDRCFTIKLKAHIKSYLWHYSTDLFIFRELA